MSAIQEKLKLYKSEYATASSGKQSKLSTPMKDNEIETLSADSPKNSSNSSFSLGVIHESDNEVESQLVPRNRSSTMNMLIEESSPYKMQGFE
jgi:hypothetical protein